VTVKVLPDAELIQSTLRGDTRAFDELVRRYQDRLIHSLTILLGSRDDALDVAQQAFVQAWKKLSLFRGESGFYSWLYRIARNTAVSRLRTNTLDARSLEQLQQNSEFEPGDQNRHSLPEHSLEQAEMASQVQSALLKVPEEFRQPLVLKELDGFSYEQISEILDIPLGTVRSRIFRGRQELLSHLQRTFQVED
jgi:RNA polymerase sigma-70 factor (ECF subfamily)